MREKRTDIDFSKHVLTINKTGNCTIYDFFQPGTNVYSVTFINAAGIMAVTGDLGNWIFCREFHPSATGNVSDRYWCEKLSYASSQDAYEFDTEEAKKQINEILEDDSIKSDEVIEWLNDLSDAADNEYEYIAKAMDYPNDYEAECIPRGKIIKNWLNGVFDAFDEMCRRITCPE